MGLVDLLIYLAILVIVAIVVWYILSQLQLPDPLGRIIMILVAVVFAVVVILLLLGLLHGGGAIKLGAITPLLLSG